MEDFLNRDFIKIGMNLDHDDANMAVASLAALRAVSCGVREFVARFFLVVSVFCRGGSVLVVGGDFMD